MTRKKIGSKRTSRNSFVDDKTDAALRTVSELSATVKTKMMRPIGAGPLPPPNLVRNADNDAYIYEGIPWINRGRGIPDPTPGSDQQPLNRRLRRESQAGLGTPMRTTAARSSRMVTMSYADGPVAGMADARNMSRPENVVPIDESSSAVLEMETRVDAILGPRPQTLKEATDNLSRLENIVNSSSPNGNNFKFEIPYFASQMQPELATVSPRFSGANTRMSSYDYGIYYGVAINLLSYPEAFSNMHLVIAPSNNPDSPTDDGVGGSAIKLPSYFSVTPQSESVRKVTPYGPARATSGVKDMSFVKYDVLGGRAQSGARLPIVIQMPVYKSDGQKGSGLSVYGSAAFLLEAFSENRNAAEVETMKPPDDFLEDLTETLAFWEKVLAKTGVARAPLMDSSVMSVAFGYLRELENMQAKISQLKDIGSRVPNENALQSIRSIEQRMSEIYSEAQKVTSLTTMLHEMGHVLDAVGEYKMAPDATAIARTSTGLNSEYELMRDLSVKIALEQGMDHPIKDDIAETFSRKFVKRELLKMISVVSKLNSLPSIVASGNAIMLDLLKLKPLTESLTGTRNQGNGIPLLTQAVLEMNRTKLESINGLVSPASIVNPMINSGLFTRDMLSKPEDLSRIAEQLIAELQVIGENSISSVPDYNSENIYNLYRGKVKKIVEDARKRIDLFSSATHKATALAATAIAVKSLYEVGLSDFLSGVSNEEASLVNQELDFEFAREWFSNNVSQDEMDSVGLDGGRNIMTNLIADNPGAVREFMEAYGKQFNKPWFDDQGRFNSTEYLKYVLGGPNGPRGMGSDTVATTINQWHNGQGTNGWKNLSDEEIRLALSAVSKLTDYAGPADYAFSIPLPKFQSATNKETYAELHPIMLMKLETLMQRLSDKERRAVEKLHEQMITQARMIIGRFGGRAP